MKFKKVIFCGVVGLSAMYLSPMLLASSDYYGNDVNVWHYNGAAANEVGREKAKLMRDEHLNNLISDPEDYKVADEQPVRQHKPKHHAPKKAKPQTTCAQQQHPVQ
jgi:hypothetical protein